MPLDLSALTVQKQITAIYIGYYDRAPDPFGLAFWENVMESGSGFSLADVATDYAGQDETLAAYPFFEAPTSDGAAGFITELYMNLFNRAPDQEGLEFWAGVLESAVAGEGSVSIGEIILAIIEGAQDTDEGNDRTTILNKIAVAEYWTNTADQNGLNEADSYPNDDAAQASAKSIIEAVTDDETTVQAAEAEIADFFLAATYNLTTGVDAGDQFSGDIADDVFNAPIGLGIDGLVGVQTLQSTDVIDGNDGSDTLNAELNGTGANGNPTITGVEKYYLTSFAAPLGFNSGFLDLSRSTGYEELWNLNSRVDLGLFNVQEQAAVGMENVLGGTNYTVQYDADLSVSNQVVAALSVGTEASGTATVRINGAEIDSMTLFARSSDLRIATDNDVSGVLSVNVTDGNNINLNNQADQIAELQIAGDGLLELGSDSKFSQLEALDATGYVNDLDLDVSGSDTLVSASTGEGDDRLIFNGAAANGALTVEMAGGTDALVVSGPVDEEDISDLDFSGGVTGVEVLGFQDRASLGDDAVLDLDGISDALETVRFYQGLDGNYHELAIAGSPVSDLRILSTTINNLDLDTGNVENLSIETTSGELDIDELVGDALQTLTLNMTGDAGVSDPRLYLDVDGENANLNALTTIIVNVNGEGVINEADVEIDDEDADSEGLQSLANVIVTSDDDVELEMEGADSAIDAAKTAVAAAKTELENFAFDATTGGDPLGDRVDGDAANRNGLTTLIENSVNLTLEQKDALIALIPAVTGRPPSFNQQSEFDTFLTAARSYLDGTVASIAPEGDGFEALEIVKVEAGRDADVDLDDLYGAFDLQVSAGDDANVDLADTGAVSASVSVGSTFEYIIDAITGDVIGVKLDDTLNLADVSASGGTHGSEEYGNEDLVTMTVSGAAARVVLEDGLSSFTTLDLTDVANAFNVDAADAIFAPDDGGYVSYLVGSTASEFGGFLDGGDSLIAMADARESVTFTEEQFGTIVLENFISGADPQVGDRIDVSDLGYTNNGQLLFETGTYDKASGDFTVDAGNDLRISDVDGGPAMDGEIILIGIDNPDDLATYNIIYA